MQQAPPPRPAAATVKAAVAASSPGITRSQGRKASTGKLGWLVGFGIIILLLLGVVMGRNEIVAGFPASAPIYQSLGLPVDIELGLEFADVKSDWQVDGGASVLVVEGEIVNLSEGNRVIPPIRIAILDAEGRELQHEFFELEEAVVNSGERTWFSGRLVNPVEQGANFRLTFDLES